MRKIWSFIFIPTWGLFFVFWKWTNTEYLIVLFDLNYSNTKYLKSNSSTPKNFICKFSDQMRWGKFDPIFSYINEGFFKNSRTIQYMLKSIWVLNIIQKSQMNQIPNTNSTIRSQLFGYQILQIIQSNSELKQTLNRIIVFRFMLQLIWIAF